MQKICATVLLLAMGLVWGCTPPPPPDGEAALQEIQRQVDETAAAVAGSLDYSGAELADSPMECKPWWAVNTGRTWGYAVTLELEDSTDTDALVRKVYEYWQAAAYPVKGRNINTEPSLHMNIDGGNFEFFIDEAASKAYITGSTPCLPVVEQGATQADS